MLGSTLAQFGRSKEKRSDCPLVSIGLLSNELGFIRRSDFYAGNIRESATFEQVLTLALNNGGIMTDAGIATGENIERAVLRGVPYLCVVPEKFARYEVDFSGAEVFDHQPSNGTKAYKVWVYVQENHFQIQGRCFSDRLIFVKSQAKQAVENAIVLRQKQRMEAGLEGIKASLSKPRGEKNIQQMQQRIGRLKENNKSVSQAFNIQLKSSGQTVQAIEWAYDSSAEARKGTYVIRTSMPINSARQGWETYHLMANIEAVNRRCKTDLNIRPVYHQKDHTIKAHLLLSLLACSVANFILFRLAKHNIHYCWKEVVRIMNTHKTTFSEFKNNQKEYILCSLWSQPEQKAAAIYKALAYSQSRTPGFFFKVKVDDS